MNPKMVKFGLSYGFDILTCVPYDPASKGGVERSVRIAKDHLCPKDSNLMGSYESIAELKEVIDTYNREINSKIHASSGKIPDLALREERAVFSKKPTTPYVAAYGIMRRVESNMPIVRYRNYGYSVPSDLRGSSVYVRDSGDEVVIVSATKYDVKEVARHKRGKPYGYVISDTHKDPKHPNGPLLRHPIPTNKTEAKFLAISPTACVWLENAARIDQRG
jgi:hypothetical protein